MSDPEILRPAPDQDSGAKTPRGPNLALLYSLIALALAVAIAIAMFIVMPFYRRN
jgi:hypothetical protein